MVGGREMICFAVIMLLVAVATVSGLLWYSARVDIDPNDNHNENKIRWNSLDWKNTSRTPQER